jgi:hypothetical protein
MANQIAGNLPWGGGGAGLFSGFGGSAQQSMANLGSNYANAYSSALAMNQQNYQNTLAGFQTTLDQNSNARAGIGTGYDQLLSSVLGGISNIGQSRQNDINAAYTQQSGALAQQLVNRGLGNSTVQGSMQRGVAYDQARASTDLANQIAQTTAGFQSQLGQAGLGYRERMIQQNDADAMAQLNWMNSVNAAYPDAGMYSQLAQQFGAANQQEQDRALAMGRGMSNPPPSGGGYVPSGGGMPASRAGAGGGTVSGFAPMGSTYGLLGFAPENAGRIPGIGVSAYDSPGTGDGYANPGESKGYGESIVGPGSESMPGYDLGYGGPDGGTGKGGGGGGGGGWADIGAAIAAGTGGGGWGDYSWLS